MAKRDYYEVLGVDRNADDAALKQAYRRLAMKYHPDRTQNDAEAEARFKEAKEAYDVLGDARKRAAYDQFGHAGVDAAGAGFGGPGGPGAAGFGDIFGDMFGDIFGGGGGPRRARGADLRYGLELTLEEAVHGVEKEIRVPKRVQCAACSGSGAKPGSKPQTCNRCEGRGQVRMQQGFFSVQQTCPQCRGRGDLITDPCASCGGGGLVREEKTLSVKIPAGVDAGDQVRLSGEGEGAAAGPAGDLYVQVRLARHAIFERDGDNLYCEVPVSFTTMALGGSLEIPTLSGRANLKVPAESQSEKIFRLRGKGVRNVRSGRQGDLYCKVVVETPVNLTAKQKELLKHFDQSLAAADHRHAPRSSSWRNKIKTFFEDLVD